MPSRLPVKRAEVQLIARAFLPDALFPTGLSGTAILAAVASRASRRARSRSVFFRVASWWASYSLLAFCLSSRSFCDDLKRASACAIFDVLDNNFLDSWHVYNYSTVDQLEEPASDGSDL
jgi:hypothetical protein